MRNVTVAVVQMQCAKEVEANIAKADAMVREAAAKGAKIILLPELFERPYFCQERQYEYYAYATPTAQNPAVQHFRAVAKELGVVLPISFYEKAGTQLFNSIAVLDADGTLLGVYRKTHIPDDHYYQEKFYFTPGDTGFKVWDTRFGRIGIGICWDQWFPETARSLALMGAELLLYPTAIGSEPILDCDSAGHWRRCMQGHAGSNLVPVLAANRIGLETVEPCRCRNRWRMHRGRRHPRYRTGADRDLRSGQGGRKPHELGRVPGPPPGVVRRDHPSGPRRLRKDHETKRFL